MSNEENFSEKESLQLITNMINKTKQSFHETGFGPIMWGSVIAICSIVTFCSIQFNFELPFDIWLLTLIAIIPQIIYSIKQSKTKKVKTFNDVAIEYTWIAFGISIFLLSFTINTISNDLVKSIPNYINIRAGFRLYNHTSAFFLLLYAIPTFITGGITKYKPMLFGGILFWLFSLISNYTPANIDMILTAIGAIVAWLIPGIMLNIQYRKSKNV